MSKQEKKSFLGGAAVLAAAVAIVPFKPIFLSCIRVFSLVNRLRKHFKRPRKNLSLSIQCPVNDQLLSALRVLRNVLHTV